MKHTLRCHDFGWQFFPGPRKIGFGRKVPCITPKSRQPEGVAATIAASFVANLANTASIGCGSLRAIDDSDSQRTHVSLCQAL
jgi:hypothetical protein